MGRQAILSIVGFWLLSCNGSVASSQEESTREERQSVQAGNTILKDAAHERTEERKVHLARLRRSLGPVLSRKRDGLHQHTTASGQVIVPLEGRFRHAMMARVGTDGRLEYGCFDAVERAVGFVEPSKTEAAK